MLEKDKLEGAEFVYDSSDMTIIGVATKRSSGFNNEELLRAILSALDKRNIDAIFPYLEDFNFISGNSINTRFRLSLASKVIKCEFNSNRAKSTDYNEIGLDIANDVIIGNNTRISILVHNPVKANSILLPMLGRDGQLTYSGNYKKLEKQLQGSIEKALKQLNKAVALMEKLSVTPFSATTIAKHTDVKKLLAILPGRELEESINKRLRSRDYSMLSKNFAALQKNADRLILLGELIEMNNSDGWSSPKIAVNSLQPD